MIMNYARIDKAYHNTSGCGPVLATCIFRIIATELAVNTVEVVNCRTKKESCYYGENRIKIDRKSVIGAQYRIASAVLIECDAKGNIKETKKEYDYNQNFHTPD